MTLARSDLSIYKPWMVFIGLGQRVGIDLENITSRTGRRAVDKSDSWIALKSLASLTGRTLDPRRNASLTRLTMMFGLLEKLLTFSIQDTCTCACSESGYSVIPALMIGYLHSFNAVETGDESCNGRAPQSLAWIRAEFISLMREFPKLSGCINESQRWCTAIVRFWTFERLGITHVCCLSEKTFSSRGVATQSSRDPTETHAIQEEESNTIAQLDSLVSEFTMKREELTLGLEDFFEEYWDARMFEVAALEEVLNEFYKKAVEKIGVTLD